MHLGEIIKEYRNKNNLSMGDFAEKSGISKAYISILEKNRDPRNGKKVTPSIPIIKKAALGMNVTFDELFNSLDNDTVVSFKSSPLLSQITETAAKLHEPRQEKVLTFTQDQLDKQEGRVKEILSYYDFTCYGAVSAGTGEWLGEEQKEKVSLPSSIVPHHPFDFVLRVNGDSMEPLFKNHEYVFVKKVDEVRSGQIGVFIVDGEAYLKKVYIEKDHLRLVSLNKAYDDLVFDDKNEIKAVGVVVL